MFNLGKLPNLSRLLSTGDVSSVIKGALSEVEKMTGTMSQATAALGKAGGAGGPGVAALGKAAGAGGPLGAIGSQIAGTLSGILQPGATQKLLYLSILRQAMEKATASQHFNVETHINDLWVKLSQIRQNEPDIAKLQQAMQQQQELMQMVSNIIQKYDQTAKSVAQNLR